MNSEISEIAMDKALKMGQDSTKGTFLLFIGRIGSTILLAIGAILVGVFIEEGDLGLYTIALIPAATILLFHDWGVGQAITRYCAQKRGQNKEGELRKIITVGLAFEAAIGLVLTLISLLIADSLASNIFGKPEAGFFIMISSITILSTSLLTAAQAIFLGFERMHLSNITFISQAVVQSVLSILLVYMGYGALGAVLGYTLGVIISAIVAMSLLAFVIIRNLPNVTNVNTFNTLKLLLGFGVPLGISSILGGILASFYPLMMASFVNETTIGNYRIALNFIALISFFTIPVSSVLFPTFSKINIKKELQLLRSAFASSVKYSYLFLAPVSMALIVLSKPIVSTLYGDKWVLAPFFLALAASIHLFGAFGPISQTSLLSALGKTRLLMKLNLLAIAIGIPLSFLLIPQLGIPGVILVDILDTLPSLIICTYWVRKHYGAITELKTTGKMLLASTIAAAVTYLFITVFSTASAWIMLTIGATLFIMTYLIAIPFIGAINQKDVSNLRSMFSKLGFVSKILEVPLRIIEHQLRFLSRAKKEVI